MAWMPLLEAVLSTSSPFLTYYLEREMQSAEMRAGIVQSTRSLVFNALSDLKEMCRDILEQQTNVANTALLVDSLLLSVAFAMVIEGQLPTAEDVGDGDIDSLWQLEVAYATFLGASFMAIVASILWTSEFQRRLQLDVRKHLSAPFIWSTCIVAEGVRLDSKLLAAMSDLSSKSRAAASEAAHGTPDEAGRGAVGGAGTGGVTGGISAADDSVARENILGLAWRSIKGAFGSTSSHSALAATLDEQQQHMWALGEGLSHLDDVQRMTAHRRRVRRGRSLGRARTPARSPLPPARNQHHHPQHWWESDGGARGGVRGMMGGIGAASDEDDGAVGRGRGCCDVAGCWRHEDGGDSAATAAYATGRRDGSEPGMLNMNPLDADAAFWRLFEHGMDVGLDSARVLTLAEVAMAAGALFLILSATVLGYAEYGLRRDNAVAGAVFLCGLVGTSLAVVVVLAVRSSLWSSSTSDQAVRRFQRRLREDIRMIMTDKDAPGGDSQPGRKGARPPRPTEPAATAAAPPQTPRERPAPRARSEPPRRRAPATLPVPRSTRAAESPAVAMSAQLGAVLGSAMASASGARADGRDAERPARRSDSFSSVGSLPPMRITARRV